MFYIPGRHRPVDSHRRLAPCDAAPAPSWTRYLGGFKESLGLLPLYALHQWISSPGFQSFTSTEPTPFLHCQNRHHHPQQMSFQDLTAFNEMLRNQIWDLRDLVADLSTRNHELREETKNLEVLNRSLQAKIGCFKTLVEELQKEIKNIKHTLQEREWKLRQLEYKNKTLNRTNKQLNSQINDMAGQLSAYEGYQTAIDLLGGRSEAQKIKNCAQRLEGKLEGLQQQYEEEKQQTSRLRDALRELCQIWEGQRNDIMQLKGELETAEKQTALWRQDHEGWLLVGSPWEDREGIKMLEISSEQAKMKKLHWPCDLKKTLSPLMAWVTLGAGLALLNTHFVKDYFNAGILLLLLSDHHICMIVELLSEYLSCKK